MCLRRQQAPTFHSKNCAPILSSPLTAALSQYWPKNATQPWSRVVSRYLTHSRLLRLVGGYRAFVAVLFYWLELPGCASLCYRLLIAASVHMSCCVEWVRPMRYTIISCQRRFSSTWALSLPGPYRKRPDTNLQTKRMRQELRIIHGNLSNTTIHVFIPD